MQHIQPSIFMTGIFDKELLIDYSGPIDFKIKKDLVALLREKVNMYVSDPGKRKRCSYIFEELLTNPHDYYKQKSMGEEPIQVSLELVNKSVIEVCISNTILKSDTDALLSRIEIVNQGNEEALRELFHLTMEGDSLPNIGGGIGLITVKIKNGFSYTFEIAAKNKTQNLFCLTTSINVNQ
jgi:hypothetical protein